MHDYDLKRFDYYNDTDLAMLNASQLAEYAKLLRIHIAELARGAEQLRTELYGPRKGRHQGVRNGAR